MLMGNMLIVSGVVLCVVVVVVDVVGEMSV